MRVGLVGLGRVVERYHLPALTRLDRWVLAAGCDPSSDRRDAVRPRFRGLPLEASLEDMLQRSELDAVLIASPPSLHARQAARALEAGLAVLVEKPMATNADEAEGLLRTLQHKGGVLRVGLNRRFLPAYRELRAAVRTRAALQTELALSFSFPMKAWGAYSADLEGGIEHGDVLDDVGSHMVDLVRWIRGGPIVEARGVRIGPSERDIRFDLRLWDGQLAHCKASHGPTYQEEMTVSTAAETFRVQTWSYAQHRRGDAFPGGPQRLRSWLDRKFRRLLGMPDPMMQSFIAEWEDLAAARKGTVPGEGGATAEDGLRAFRVLEAIRRSQATGGDWVRVPGEGGSVGGSGREENGPEPRRGVARAAADAQPIEVSIVLVAGNQRDRAARTLRELLSQDGLDRVEILLLDAGSETSDPLPGSDHSAVRLVHQDRTISFGEMRARGARRARGRWVAFIEEHCFPLPGWLPAALSSFNGPWVAIGGEMHSANPGVGVSDATAIMNYGDWRPPALRGDSRLLPGHNVFYRRDILREYDAHLGDLLQAEAILHMKLTEAGHRIGINPSIRFGHLNETSTQLICRSYWHWHRSFAGVRAKDGEWTRARRWIRALASPLVPWVRSFRLLRSAFTYRRQDLAVLAKFLPTIVLAQVSAAAGLGVGYLFGPGSAPTAFLRCELDVDRELADPPRG